MIRVACVIFLFMVVITPKSGEAAGPPSTVPCNRVVGSLSPCIGYVVGGGAMPAECCTGVKTLWSSASKTSDRQNICNCLKQVIKGISLSSYNLAQLAGLPAKCGVNIPYKISPSTNCKSVK